MPCFDSTKKIAEAKTRVDGGILARLEDEHETLARLAFVITGDIETAERSVREASDLAKNGAHSLPFPKHFTEWVKRVTIETAITNSLEVIARCESRYVNHNCTHSEHLLNGNDSKLQELRNFLLNIDPEIVVAELDPLARAVAIMRTTARASILDCILRLQLSLDTVLAANCKAMIWIAEKRTGLSDKAPTPEPKLEKS